MEQQTGYSQIKMRDNYRKQYSSQRNKNLVHLRFDIAKMNLSEFASKIGIVKSNLSEIEDGKRDLSIGNIHSYRTYFKDNHNFIVSTDYLLGYTDIIENQSLNVAKDLGLSNDAITVFRNMSDEGHDVLNKLTTEKGMLEFLLGEMWIYANNSSFTDIKITNHITDSTEIITNITEIDQIMKARTIDSFSGIILRFIKKAYEDSITAAAENKIKMLELENKILSLKNSLKKKDGD